MNHYQKLNRFPLGAIQAEGFLKEQMLLAKEGMTGHLFELEPGMIADPYINKTYVPGWSREEQAGWGAEISGNYWSGYIQAAFTLDDREMIETATNWVNTMMKKQRDDGYLGTYYEEDAKIFEDYNAWGTACAMRGLIAFYEATGRRDVLKAVHRCMLWFCKNWAGDRKTCYSGPLIIETMIFTYYYTKDEQLISFSKDYAEYLCSHDIFHISYEAMLKEEYHYNSNHTAGYGVSLRLPALLYTVTGKEKYLEASRKKIAAVREKSVHLSGGPVSVTEYLGPVGSTTETEYCSFAFYNATYSYMSYITGEAVYGDYMEELFYNGAQGARKKDEKAIAYLSAPNQIYATGTSSTTGTDQQVYAPCHPVACCPVNSVAVVPEFIRGMILHDEENNLYAAAYGPCRLRYQGIDITEKTMYPFRNRAAFLINSGGKFALNLKIPEWSQSYVIRVNGEKIQGTEKSKGYVKVQQSWNEGDVVEISFEAKIQVIRVDDTDAAKKYPLAVKYGALLFSYHIPETWEPVPGRPVTPLPEGWSWFDVQAAYEKAECSDHYEEIGLRRNQISWNIALDETLSASDFEIEELPESGYVWSHPLVRLHTYCYKAPYLCAMYPFRTFEPYGEYQYVTEKLPLVLEPYGCTNLRITYFPKAKL